VLYADSPERRGEALVEEAASPACVLDGHGRIIVANRARCCWGWERPAG
jgi:hypothetical protein